MKIGARADDTFRNFNNVRRTPYAAALRMAMCLALRGNIALPASGALEGEAEIDFEKEAGRFGHLFRAVAEARLCKHLSDREWEGAVPHLLDEGASLLEKAWKAARAGHLASNVVEKALMEYERGKAQDGV